LKPIAAIALALAVSCAGCGATGQSTAPTSVSPEASPKISWPAPPQKARVSYLYSFRAPADLGYRESLGNEIKDLLGGGEFEGMIRPYALAADDRMLIVADPGLSAVHIFDHRRKRYWLLNSAANTSFGSPVGAALGRNRLYVADSALNRVFVLDERRRLVGEIGGFERPTGLAYDHAQERLYVADTHAHVVRKYDRDGQFIGSLGERGDADGQFNFPTHLDIRNGRLFVNDTLNFRVQIFDLESGQHLGNVGEHGDQAGFFAQPKGIVAGPGGNLFVTEAIFGSVQIFSPKGDYLLDFGSPGPGPGQFQLPGGLAFWDNRIYVADSGNRRIQVFEYADQ
jgi:DNA-binding beta-propeller fold protein YncE